MTLQTVDPRFEPVWVRWDWNGRLWCRRLFHSSQEKERKGLFIDDPK